MSRPQAKYVRVDSSSPSAAALCDRCGRQFNLRSLTWQYEWAGEKLYNTRALVCTQGDCLDVPQEQLRTIILPPDPPPLPNARVPYFDYEEQTVRIVQFADTFGPPWAAGPQLMRCDQTGKQERVIQYLTQSAPGPAPGPGEPGFILGESILGGGDVLQ